MATVTLQNVKKSFGTTDVIHGIDVSIQDGEFIVIVGPSGCGKSTLLRMVAGLETATSGDIFIGDERANDKEPMDRDIAMVFQNYALYPHMSVRQNMGYGLKSQSCQKMRLRQRCKRPPRFYNCSRFLTASLGNYLEAKGNVLPWGGQ